MQLSPTGWLKIVMLYVLPLASGVGKVKLATLAFTARLSSPLSCKTSPGPVSPVIEPLMLYNGSQVTLTFVTLAEALPLPLITAQLSPAGCVSTVTLYTPPLATEVAKVKLVAFALRLRSLPPLFCKTNPVPVNPATVPPTVYAEGVGGVDFPGRPQPITDIPAISNKVQIPNLFSLFISLTPFSNKVDFRR
jgi:hypothetical protein